MDRIDEIVSLACKAGASDLHIAAHSPPVCRIQGRLLSLDDPDWPAEFPAPKDLSGAITSSEAGYIARRVMTEEQYRQLLDLGECDFSYTLAEVCRCRVNAFKQQRGVSLAFRLLRKDIPTLEELGLPRILASLCHQTRGLILMTGSAGSGKSTTLAAMIDLINRESSSHIITLEDPVEYIHQPRKSLISQREVGRDSRSFASALRAALREDPDVILVGEMRDAETMAIALTAAETGHLVLGTLHTTGAAQAADRVVNAFPPHQLPQIRTQLSNTLLGITAQALLPGKAGAGRVAVMEILVANPAVRNLIREGKTFQIINLMQTGAKYGMQTMEMALRQAAELGLVDSEAVFDPAGDP